MIGYELFVVPSPETLAFFQQSFSGCPFEVRPENFRVTIATTIEPPEPKDTVYYCRAGSMKLYANATNQGGSLLLLPLVSADDPKHSMLEHNRAIVQECGSAYDLMYSPHLVVVEHLPPLRNYVRGWINSLSGVFHNSQHVFTFSNETVECKELDPIPNSFYYLQEVASIVEMMQRQMR